jgi:hypothetical protein
MVHLVVLVEGLMVIDACFVWGMVHLSATDMYEYNRLSCQTLTVRSMDVRSTPTERRAAVNRS